MPTDIDWPAARKLIPRRADRINLNSGTLSPTPMPVLDAVTRLRQMQAGMPSDFYWRQMPGLLLNARKRLAAYVHARPLDVVLLPNVTFAINIVAESLQLPAGSEILTTDHEYGAMMFVMQRLANRQNLHIQPITLPYRTEDPAEIVAAMRGQMNAKTRVVFFSHCNTSTGLVMPAEQIVRAARERAPESIVIVDGAHAPGMIDVNIDRIGADFYGANCHKWMMCPAGAGFLHVRADRRAMVQPLITSWGWEYDRAKLDDDSGWGGSFWQRDLEFHGTLDRCPQMVIPDAIDFRDNVLGGDASVHARTRELVEYTRAKLKATCGLAAATPSNPALSGSMIAFDFPTKDPVNIRDRMWNDFQIECPVTGAAGKTFLRVSCAWFNTREEIDKLAEAAKRLLAA